MALSVPRQSEEGSGKSCFLCEDMEHGFTAM